jgi:hypothetical protein
MALRPFILVASKIAFICFRLFFRIGAFLWTAEDSNGNSALVSGYAQSVSNEFSLCFRRPVPPPKLEEAGRKALLALPVCGALLALPASKASDRAPLLKQSSRTGNRPAGC